MCPFSPRAVFRPILTCFQLLKLFNVERERDHLFAHMSKPLIYVHLLHFRMMYWQSVASLVSPGGILVSSSIQIGPVIFFFFIIYMPEL
jgi:hypothetical protein